MRLLIYGSRSNPNTIASFFIRNFDSSLQYQVLKFPDQFAALVSSKSWRFIYRYLPVILVRKLDRSFLRQVEQFQPTVILIFKGMEISKWSLKRIKESGIKLVNYNFDHPFSFFSRGTGNRFVKEAIPYYDLHISYSSIIVEQLGQRYNVNTAWLPFGFHLTKDQFEEVLAENRREINRACFVGNPDELRVAALKRLESENIPLSLYGFGWDKFFSESEFVEIHHPRKPGSFWSDPAEFWKVLRQYRIQLNFFRPHNEGSHNLRTFEVPAVGGILLTPESAEQSDFFEVGQEIFTYNSFTSLLHQCRTLLAMDAFFIGNVRVCARHKCLAKDYSYHRRTRELLVLLEDLEKG